jgi:Co/Zn/Cd efflux system component
MGKSCCENKSSELSALLKKQGGVLKTVLIVNALMFFVEFISGILVQSTALMADSLDMLGDASVYAFSLYVLHKGARWRARAGYAKGLVMAAFAVVVLSQALYRYANQAIPEAFAMGLVGALALGANFFCLVLLYQHRSDDINMRSTWICSRNDITANLTVILASWLVLVFHSGVPDLIAGSAIAGLFMWSAKDVISQARHELQ